MVSIIVPVYNVEKYLDRCIESIVGQTYTELDIVILNDGSRDHSAEKCKEWAMKDSRIRFFSHENMGLGPTRNKGVELAKGKYVMFVDSDDWVEKTIVEELLIKLEETDSDIAVCDRYNILERVNKKEYISNDIDDVINVMDNKSCIYNVTTSAWGKLYKKDLIVDNRVFEPDQFFEDAVTPVLLALSNRICHIKKPLYNYVYDRSGSIINSMKSNEHLVMYLQFVVDEFKKRGLFDAFHDELKDLFIKRAWWSLWNASKNMENEYWRLKDEYSQIYKDVFKDNKFGKFDTRGISNSLFIWGSYNLMICTKRVTRNASPLFLKEHCCFSSLISAMQDDCGHKLNQYCVSNDNDFRNFHLLQDFKRSFLNMNRGEFRKVKYVLIDFLEERFPIGIKDGMFFTESEAFLTDENTKELTAYSYLDDALKLEEWKKACDRFISLLNNYNHDMKVILVKMKLCKSYGNKSEMHLFHNQDEIDHVNKQLDEMYAYFESKCMNVITINIDDNVDFYTDKDFKHGCYPWHLNQDMYIDIQFMIEKIIENNV